jgi:hypothetical protein
MVSRKRAREEAAAAEAQDTTPATPAPEKEDSLLVRLRNTWEFANLMQWIFIFGKAVKIDEEFDVEVCATLALGLDIVRWDSPGLRWPLGDG